MPHAYGNGAPLLLSLRLRYSRGFCKAKGPRMRAPRAVALSQVANPPRLGARLGCRVVEVEGKKIGGGPGPGLAAAMPNIPGHHETFASLPHCVPKPLVAKLVDHARAGIDKLVDLGRGREWLST